MEKKPIIRRASEAFVAWCADNSAAAKFERSVAQGVIGVASACLAGIAGAPEWVQVGLVPTVMAVIAPTQAWIGGKYGEQ